uniref:Uncharacterized protein n=1 Tax=Opuntia streptacantha TaxID=393608 RepID=A0A7C8YIH0_OPUST
MGKLRGFGVWSWFEPPSHATVTVLFSLLCLLLLCSPSLCRWWCCRRLVLIPLRSCPLSLSLGTGSVGERWRRQAGVEKLRCVRRGVGCVCCRGLMVGGCLASNLPGFMCCYRQFSNS